MTRFARGLPTHRRRWLALARPLPLLALMPLVLLIVQLIGGQAALVAVAVAVSLLALAVPPLAAQRATMPDLPDRGMLERHLATHLERAGEGGRTACLVLALDECPDHARRFGPDQAREILADVTERVLQQCRSGDLVAALAPGRFAVSPAPGGRFDLEAALQLALRLQTGCAAPLWIAGQRVDPSLSIGVAQSGRLDEMTAAGLIASAETALAAARREGPGRIRAFSRNMRPAEAVKADLVRDLAEALDSGAIRPWVQPQICTDTGALTGVEALARWEHPRHGTLPPAEFLPTIRAAGLSHRLADRVLSRALAQLSDWDREAVDVPRISVNFSEMELSDPSLPERVGWALDRYGLHPARLGIEVLETVVARNPDDVIIRNLAALQALGCHIDLDDFGTGHASISAIRGLAVRRLKIDRSFVRGVDTDRDQQDMVAAILTMAEQLSLDTLAEGVETAGEHAILAQLGCGHVQGFAIARPMPPEALAPWLDRRAQELLQTRALAPTGTASPRRSASGGKPRPGPVGRGKTA